MPGMLSNFPRINTSSVGQSIFSMARISTFSSGRALIGAALPHPHALLEQLLISVSRYGFHRVH